jgi:hypothetical protein
MYIVLVWWSKDALLRIVTRNKKHGALYPQLEKSFFMTKERAMKIVSDLANFSANSNFEHCGIQVLRKAETVKIGKYFLLSRIHKDFGRKIKYLGFLYNYAPNGGTTIWDAKSAREKIESMKRSRRAKVIPLRIIKFKLEAQING